jgi:hypothetical protein
MEIIFPAVKVKHRLGKRRGEHQDNIYGNRKQNPCHLPLADPLPPPGNPNDITIIYCRGSVKRNQVYFIYCKVQPERHLPGIFYQIDGN